MVTSINNSFAVCLVIILSLLLCPISLFAQKKEKEAGEALEADIPAAARVLEILDEANKPYRGFSYSEHEYLAELSRLLSTSGDRRAKDTLLEVIFNASVGEHVIAECLFILGPQVLPDIINLLDDEKIETKRRAIIYLVYIYKYYDRDRTFFSDKDKKEIKERLLPYLKDDDGYIKLYTVEALGYFGDKSVIPLIEKVLEDNKPETRVGISGLLRDNTIDAAKESILRLKAENVVNEDKNDLLQKETAGGLMIGVAATKGIILPIAVYAGGKWADTWPQDEYDEVFAPRIPPEKMYKGMDEIPKTWYEPLEKIPEEWNIIYPDGKAMRIEISKPALAGNWCFQRWALIGEVTKKVKDPGDNYAMDNADGLLLATTGHSTGSGMKAPGQQSDEYSEIYKLVDDTISESERTGNQSLSENDRETVKTELTTILRNETPQDGCFIYYVEARKVYPVKDSDQQAKGRIIFPDVPHLNGWILRDSNNKLSFMGNFEFTRDRTTSTPSDEILGILTLDGRSYWIIRDWRSYESERWLIFDVSPLGVKKVLEVSGGGC